MDTLEGIKEKVGRRQYEFSKHAVDQTIVREISVAEVDEGLLGESEVIEDYPKDKYGPSCLILGFSRAGRPRIFNAAIPAVN